VKFGENNQIVSNEDPSGTQRLSRRNIATREGEREVGERRSLCGRERERESMCV